MQLQPYVCFYGKTEEALKFYATAIGGTFEIARYEGTPAAQGMEPAWQGKVMHSTFTGDGFAFMASDGPPNAAPRATTGEAEICMSLAANDAETGRRIFDALAEGGKVTQPYEDAFWGGKFGMVDDRFGLSWMITGGH